MTQEQLCQLSYKLGLITGKFDKIIEYCVDKDEQLDEIKCIHQLLTEAGNILMEGIKS